MRETNVEFPNLLFQCVPLSLHLEEGTAKTFNLTCKARDFAVVPMEQCECNIAYSFVIAHGVLLGVLRASFNKRW